MPNKLIVYHCENASEYHLLLIKRFNKSFGKNPKVLKQIQKYGNNWKVIIPAHMVHSSNNNNNNWAFNIAP